MYLLHKRCSIAVPRGRHVHLNDPLISPYHKPSPPPETEGFIRPAEWAPKLPAVSCLHSWCTAKWTLKRYITFDAFNDLNLRTTRSSLLQDHRNQNVIRTYTDVPSHDVGRTMCAWHDLKGRLAFDV